MLKALLARLCATQKTDCPCGLPGERWVQAETMQVSVFHNVYFSPQLVYLQYVTLAVFVLYLHHGSTWVCLF